MVFNTKSNWSCLSTYQHWQAPVNGVLSVMINHFVFVSLDDILIFIRSLQEQILHVWAVLQWVALREECEFHSSTVSFLGFILMPKTENVDAVKDCQFPKVVTSSDNFWVLWNFTEFPITVPSWPLFTSQQAFSHLEDWFTFAPVLTLWTLIRSLLAKPPTHFHGLFRPLACLSQLCSDHEHFLGAMHPILPVIQVFCTPGGWCSNTLGYQPLLEMPGTMFPPDVSVLK